MFEVLKSPTLCFDTIRNKENKKIDNYIKRLDKFWKKLIKLSKYKPSRIEGEIIFQSTYIDKNELKAAGFSIATIKRYLRILEEHGYLTRDYDTYNAGISKNTGKTRKIGNALFVTLYPSPIKVVLSQRKKEKFFLKEIANSKNKILKKIINC